TEYRVPSTFFFLVLLSPLVNSPLQRRFLKMDLADVQVARALSDGCGLVQNAARGVATDGKFVRAPRRKAIHFSPLSSRRPESDWARSSRRRKAKRSGDHLAMVWSPDHGDAARCD